MGHEFRSSSARWFWLGGVVRLQSSMSSVAPSQGWQVGAGCRQKTLVSLHVGLPTRLSKGPHNAKAASLKKVTQGDMGEAAMPFRASPQESYNVIFVTLLITPLPFNLEKTTQEH